MEDSLSGQVFVITGSGKGLGYAIADELHRAGATLAHVVRSDSAADLVQQQFGERSIVIVGDVTDPAIAGTVIRATLETFGRIDGLVNNAGVIQPIGPMSEVDDESWALSIHTNLIAPYRLTAALLRAPSQGETRRIVNISSGAAHRPLDGWSAYCAGKAGLAMLTRSTQLEFGSRGILCFGLIPGLVDTDMQETIRQSAFNEVSHIPRAYLRPASEPARFAAFLLSGEGDGLAGQEVDIRDASLRQRLGLPPLG